MDVLELIGWPGTLLSMAGAMLSIAANLAIVIFLPRLVVALDGLTKAVRDGKP